MRELDRSARDAGCTLRTDWFSEHNSTSPLLAYSKYGASRVRNNFMRCGTLEVRCRAQVIGSVLNTKDNQIHVSVFGRLENPSARISVLHGGLGVAPQTRVSFKQGVEPSQRTGSRGVSELLFAIGLGCNVEQDEPCLVLLCERERVRPCGQGMG